MLSPLATIFAHHLLLLLLIMAKVYWIHELTNGARLGTMARPRGDQWLEDDITSLQKQGVSVLVSLLERGEVYELGLALEAESCAMVQIKFVNFPIPDREIPTSNAAVDALVNELKDLLSKGHSIAIHCRMGIGRSSIIAASVLLQKDDKVEDMIATISKARGLSVPDTEEQLSWLKKRTKDRFY